MMPDEPRRIFARSIPLLCAVFAVLIAVGGGRSAVAQSAAAQSDNAQGTGGADRQPITMDDLPWQVRLGVRALQVERAAPLVDQVVLVPDGATYLDEIARWGPAGRWPVLFEDDVYAGMFIRRFEPDEVIRRSPVGREPPSGEALRRAMSETIVAAWGGNPMADSPDDVFARANYTPPGIVIADDDDSAWTAAVALAAGRGQPLVWLDERYGRINGVLDAVKAHELQREVERLVHDAGYEALSAGDEIDAITVCKTIPARAEYPSAATTGAAAQSQGPIATTDLIGRLDDGQRYAVSGWIFGSEARSAYVAMCSLFIDEQHVKLVNMYDSSGGFGAFAMRGAGEALEERGYSYDLTNDDGAALVPWLLSLVGGWRTDVAFINTRGNTDFFVTTRGRGTMLDVPILNTPTAIHFVHSWSFRFPSSGATIGGRWLDAGAYAYVGSVHEPYLSAFVPPEEVVNRMVSSTPFLVAARHYGGGMGARPWRVATYGDPLMTCVPPGQAERERIELDRQWSKGDVHLRAETADLLRTWAEDREDADTLAETMGNLVLLGEDEHVVKLFRAAASSADARGVDAGVARAALGALFRRGDRDGFLTAWKSSGLTDDRSRTMLWHMMGPNLGPGLNEEAVIQLQASLREPRVDIDLERLRPALERVIGSEAVSAMIGRLLQETRNNRTRRELEKLR